MRFWRQHRHSTLRALAAAVAAALLVGQLASLVHQSAVVHVRCDDHDELVHAGQSNPSVALDLARIAGPSQLDSAVAPQVHGHDHCAIAASRPQGRTLALDSQTVRLPQAPQVAPRFAHTPPPPAIPPLANAPKSSPPVA